MLRRICVVQIPARKHVLDHSDQKAPTRQHGLNHADHIQTRDMSAVKDTDHIDHALGSDLSDVRKI